MKRVLLALVLCAVCSAAVPAQELLSLEEEYRFGLQVAAEALREYPPYVDDPDMSNYVAAILTALITDPPGTSPFNGYRLFVVYSDDINAFATPGGNVFITTGILRMVTSEDMIAAILAHELGHVQLRHSAQTIAEFELIQNLSAAAEKAGTGNAGQQASMARDVITAITQKGYSRAQELDADSYALKLLYLSGYAPEAMIDVLAMLQQFEPDPFGSMDDTHPTSTVRIDLARQELKNYPANAVTQDTRHKHAERFTRIMGNFRRRWQ